MPRGPGVNTRSPGKKATLKYISKESPCPESHFVSVNNVHNSGEKHHLSVLYMLNLSPSYSAIVNQYCLLTSGRLLFNWES